MIWNAVIFGPRELGMSPLSPVERRTKRACPRLERPLACGETDAPAETPFEDGSFRLTMTFTESYPNKPPNVRFISKMFHPNIYNNGELCLDILQNRWSPTYDVAAVLTSIQSLLNDPNPARWVCHS